MNKSETKLILAFMGYEKKTYFPKIQYLIPGLHQIEGAVIWVDELDLRFHNSWDWLMPVVEKIDELEYELPEDSNLIGDITHGLVSLDIKMTYSAVVEFINWYNKQDNETK